MHPKLEQIIRKWLSERSQSEIGVLYEYLKRVVGYRNWSEDFKFMANRIPHQRLYDVYFGLDKMHTGLHLTEVMYDDIFLNEDYEKYLTLPIHKQYHFYLEGKPYMENGIIRNVHSLPNRELIKILESDFVDDNRIQISINDKMHVAEVDSQNRPFYKPRKDSEPYFILKSLLEQHVNKSQPLSGGALSKKIYRNLTKANQISTTIDKMRNKFKSQLGHELISNDSGYYLNDDYFSISIS